MTICYINLTQNIPPRDAVYFRGLKEAGVKIIECNDSSPSWKKFWVIFKKHRAIKNDYAILWVGYSGHILVPFARLISRKKIVFNSMGSLYDGIIESRKKYGFLGLKIPYIWLIDWLAFHGTDLTLVGTNTMKEYIARKFFVPKNKLIRIWTGADDAVFAYNLNTQKSTEFTVLFRGGLLPEAGIEHLIKAARILQREPVRFKIVGFGVDSPLVARMLKEFDSRNVDWISDRFPQKELPDKMRGCHISLGQLENHKRQNFYIPFKIFESMAMKIPLLVARASGPMELLTENKTCFCFNPADAQDLAEKILWAKNSYSTAQKIAENAYQLYLRELTPKILARRVLELF